MVALIHDPHMPHRLEAWAIQILRHVWSSAHHFAERFVVHERPHIRGKIQRQHPRIVRAGMQNLQLSQVSVFVYDGTMRIILAPLFLAAACTIAAPVNQPDQSLGLVSVIRVVDGDTAHVSEKNVDVTVRILGIDTPETVDPRKPVQCYGPEASALAHQLLDGQTVTLQADPNQDLVDKYNRRLAYIILPDGRNYSDVMVSAGAARYYEYDKPVSIAERLILEQNQALASRKGLWDAC